jgi:ketosteroid isomerase-like protein
MDEAPRVAAIRDCYERHNAGEDTCWLELFDENIELHFRGTHFVEDGTWHGRDTVAAWFVDYFRSFRTFRFEVHELFEQGDWVLALVGHRGVGRASGIELVQPAVACYRFANGKIVQFSVFGDRDVALQFVRGESKGPSA